MALYRRVNVNPAQTKVVDMKTLPGGSNVTLRNPPTATTSIFVGGDENVALVDGGPGTGSALSTSNGWALAAGQSLTLELGPADALYAVSGISTVTVYAEVFHTNQSAGF